MAEQRLDLRPRARADIADLRTALADHDLLLRLGLDEDVSADGLLPDLLHLDGDRVRHLVLREAKRLFAHELRDVDFWRDIAPLVLGVVERPFRQ